MRILVPVVALFALLSGCALWNKSPTTDQLVISELTAVAIQAGCSTTACYDARAAKVAAIAKVLQTATVGMAVTDLQAALQKELIALKLTPEEVAPLNSLITGLLNYLTPLVGNNPLTATAVATINQVAGWLETVAQAY